jgi:hypothetical protein
VPTQAPTAPRIDARHAHNRQTVVNDIAAFLLQHYADGVATYAETVEAALNRACELDMAEFFALGILTGHYRKSRPDEDTRADLLRHLESLLPAPVVVDDPFAGLPL